MVLDGNIRNTTDGVLDWVNAHSVQWLWRAVVLGCALFWGLVLYGLLV